MFITVSRQYAAGGSEVAALVAKTLDWTVVDNEFIDEIASRSGYAREDVESLEERVPSFLERLAQSSALSFPDVLMSTPEVIDEPEQLKLARITRDLVADLGRRDRMVFVGRAAAAVLARERDALHVRLVASKAYRIQQAIARLAIPEQEAADVLEDRDRNRYEYHREYYGRDWRDPVNYHMVLNTEQLGVEGAADMIVARARKLGW
jgi:cytidylate kinase